MRGSQRGSPLVCLVSAMLFDAIRELIPYTTSHSSGFARCRWQSMPLERRAHTFTRASSSRCAVERICTCGALQRAIDAEYASAGGESKRLLTSYVSCLSCDECYASSVVLSCVDRGLHRSNTVRDTGLRCCRMFQTRKQLSTTRVPAFECIPRRPNAAEITWRPIQASPSPVRPARCVQSPVSSVDCSIPRSRFMPCSRIRAVRVID